MSSIQLPKVNTGLKTAEETVIIGEEYLGVSTAAITDMSESDKVIKSY